jgi:hypothetical protein
MTALKNNFRKGMLLSKIPSSLLNFIANFFNTCQWNGLTFDPSIPSVTPVGITEWFFLEYSKFGESETQTRMTVENGIVTESLDMITPTWDTGYVAGYTTKTWVYDLYDPQSDFRLFYYFMDFNSIMTLTISITGGATLATYTTATYPTSVTIPSGTQSLTIKLQNFGSTSKYFDMRSSFVHTIA